MKNALEYYYNIVVNDIHQRNNNYFFNDENYYCLILCQSNIGELDSIYKLNNYLLNIGVYNHQIILNKNKEIITNINNKPYILLKMYNEMNNKIIINDIISYNSIYINYFPRLKFNNWKELWIKKIDYFEYCINQYGKQYPLLKESFGYFVGLTENAIVFLNEIDKNDKLVISHRRLKLDSTLFDLYNPLNFILDSRARDISDYFKELLLYNKISITEIINICEENIRFDEKEWKMFFARMLFPTFYFDIYENAINSKYDEKLLINAINFIPKYENAIKYIYYHISKKYSMPNIEWIKKT